MYIPASNRVNIMNIKNTMCKISDLTTEQKVSLVAEMPDDGFTDFRAGEYYIGVTKAGHWGTWAKGHHPTIKTYSEMMQLLTGKTVQFTKSDLKAGMFVKQRDGDYAVVLDKTLSTMRLYTELCNIESSLHHNSIKSCDIMAVYTTASRDTLGAHLSGETLTLIWERTEQTEAQKEMEVLQAKMDELQEQMKVVKAKI
jgi:hypothetical protein